MKTIIVYRPNTEVERPVREFMRDFQHQTGKTIETINPDTRDGAAFIGVYDILEYPTLVALDDQGQVQQMWRGFPLPTISEVSYYA